jgi:1L-myo-inositol 1-phosphate cytidylyltransferase
VLKCLIIAAGRGRRLAVRAESKPLLEIGGRSLISRVIGSGRQAGIREFVVVTGYAADLVERHLALVSREENVSVEFVRNDEWDKENGLSVFKAREAAGDRFILSMSDHLFDPAILADLAARPIADGETILAVDFRIMDNPCVDLDDVTKVRVDGDKIISIGKGISDYNAFDTGLFLGTAGLFRALGVSQAKGDFTLSGGMKILAAEGKARVMDVGGRYWIDVDDENAVEKAARWLEPRG